MKNQVSDMQTISTKRDNSKAQISRYLLDNKNKLPQEIVLKWQNLEEIEGILKDEIEGDLKRINSTIGKRKPTTFKSTFLLTLIFLGVSTVFMLTPKLLMPYAITINQCLEDIDSCKL